MKASTEELNEKIIHPNWIKNKYSTYCVNSVFGQRTKFYDIWIINDHMMYQNSDTIGELDIYNVTPDSSFNSLPNIV